jgi:hypothetical protein
MTGGDGVVETYTYDAARSHVKRTHSGPTQQFSFWILLRRLWALAAVSRTEQKENERTVITFDPFEPPLCLLQSPVCG